jgi:hypothetical protein
VGVRRAGTYACLGGPGTHAALTPAVKDRERQRETMLRWLVRALRDAKLGGASITRTRSGFRAAWSLGDLERRAPKSAT